MCIDLKNLGWLLLGVSENKSIAIELGSSHESLYEDGYLKGNIYLADTVDERYRDFPLSDILKIFHFCFEVNNLPGFLLPTETVTLGIFMC